MSNNKSDSSAPMAIFLASLVLLAINARADEKVPQNEKMKLIWTSDCPKGLPSTNNSNLCKKKIYVDETINLKNLKWEEVEDIAKISFDWKYNLKQKFAKKK